MHDHPIPVPAISSDVSSWASTPLDRWALRLIQDSVPGAPIRFALWDGFELPVTRRPIAGGLRFRNRRALFSWLTPWILIPVFVLTPIFQILLFGSPLFISEGPFPTRNHHSSKAIADDVYRRARHIHQFVNAEDEDHTLDRQCE